MVDWPNERYVRVYTRDTTTWKLLDWRARTVLLFLLRKVNRAGILDVSGAGVEGLAAVLELPLEIVEAGISQLVDPRRGVVVATPSAYVIPNYIEAQEAVQTTAHRSREYRARKRDEAMAVTFRDEDATKRGDTVTPHHAAPQAVTPIRSEPGLSDPDRTDLSEERAPARARDPYTPVPAPSDRDALKRRIVDAIGPYHAMEYNRVRVVLEKQGKRQGPCRSVVDTFAGLRALLDAMPSLDAAEERCRYAIAIRAAEAEAKKTLKYFGDGMWRTETFDRACSMTLADVEQEARAGPNGSPFGRAEPLSRPEDYATTNGDFDQ